MKYSDIQFGMASAEIEKISTPQLLLDGYLDEAGLINEALNGHRFLFLGYKGSGKTALATHLKLKSASTPRLFVNHVFLDDFPYKSFAKIVTGESEPESKYPTAWSWLLYVLLVDSFSNDQGAVWNLPVEYDNAISLLKNIGILPVGNIKDLVVQSSKKTFKVNIANAVELSTENGTPESIDMRFLHLVDYLKNITENFSSLSKHLIIVDGLDEILSSRDLQYNSLAALIGQVSRVNVFLMENSIPAKILVLCRTDLFERLPSPNKNKIRQDSSVQLDWYHDSRDPYSSDLVKLANLRAKLVYPQIKNLFPQFFPMEIEGRSIYSYLLENTRHTPRDFLQLLGKLRSYYRNRKFELPQILSGLNDYSQNYFYPEIVDELEGYLNTKEIEDVFAILSALGKRDFGLRDVEEHIKSRRKFKGIDLEKIFETMFDCSAIGHIDRSRHDRNSFTFKYRNRHSSFNFKERIILHKGVWKALNLIR